jgi:hypothetical protein
VNLCPRNDHGPSDARALLDQLEVFYGQASANVGQVYARLSGLADDRTGFTLRGHIRGPECLHSHTLPTTVPLVDLGPGPSLMARAMLPDPCFWSPQLPLLYHVHVELLQRGEVLETADRLIGIRSFGPRGRSLFLDGKRWVLRGVHRDRAPSADLEDWHAESAAMIADAPDDELCRQASHRGVLLIARIAGSQDDVALQLRRLARWPAVAVAVVASNIPATANLRNAAPNIELAQPFSCGAKVELAPWASLAVCEVDDIDQFAYQTGHASLGSFPIMAVRRLAGVHPLAAARAACDRLQRDLARIGDFAGYVV